MTSTTQPQMLSLSVLHKAGIELQTLGPIEASINVELESAARDLPFFKPVPEYPTGLIHYALLPNEIGRCCRIIFVLSNDPYNDGKIVFRANGKQISYDLKVDEWL